MSRILPSSPSLAQLKKQAKDLLKEHRSGSPEAAAGIEAHLPRCSGASPEDILRGDFSLQEAQHVIACEYGCRHWEMLCAVVAADLNLLAGLTDEHLQTLLRELDQQDFIRAFDGAGTIVSERFLSNMSLRVRTFILEATAQQELSEEERRDARHTILAKATEMAAQGRIVIPDTVAVAEFEAAIERVDFDGLAGLEDREAQTLMREVDQQALVVALVGALEPVRERFLGNMSARVRGYTESEIELSKARPGEVQAMRRRILVQAGALAARGQLGWPDADTGKPPAERPQYEVPESLHDLLARPLDHLTAVDIADLWLGIAEQARKEGILSLQPIEERAVDPFLREALQLLVDGTEPALQRDILETRLESAILPQQKTRTKMVIEALMAIQSGDNPGLIRHKLGAIYLAQSEAMTGDARQEMPRAEELAEWMRREPLARMDFDQVCDLLTDIGSLARRESISAFGPLPEALSGWHDLASEVLRRGLAMALDGTEPDEVMHALEARVETHLAELEKAHRMVIEGAMGTLAGRKPVEIAEIVRRAADGQAGSAH